MCSFFFFFFHIYKKNYFSWAVWILYACPCVFCVAPWSWHLAEGFWMPFSVALRSKLDTFSLAREPQCTDRCFCLNTTFLAALLKNSSRCFQFFGIRAIEGLLLVLFLLLAGFTAEGENIGLKADTEYIKKVLSIKLDYKVTASDSHDFFPNLLRAKDLSYVEFFPCSHQRPSFFYRDFSL